MGACSSKDEYDEERSGSRADTDCINSLMNATQPPSPYVATVAYTQGTYVRSAPSSNGRRKYLCWLQCGDRVICTGRKAVGLISAQDTGTGTGKPDTLSLSEGRCVSVCVCVCVYVCISLFLARTSTNPPHPSTTIPASQISHAVCTDTLIHACSSSTT